MGRFAVIVLFLAAGKPDKPHLTTRVFPPVQIADLGHGCADVLLTAEIRGPETEEWYCPKMEWTMPDGTRATEESDCPPFEERNSCQPARGSECALDWHLESGSFVVDKNPCGCVVPGFPRTWRRRICVPAHPKGEQWEAVVRLSKNGRVLAFETIRFLVK